MEVRFRIIFRKMRYKGHRWLDIKKLESVLYGKQI